MGDDCASGASEQTKPGSGFWWASSPLRAVDQGLCPRGTGWAFELVGRSPTVVVPAGWSHQLG